MRKIICCVVRFRLRFQYENDWLALCYDSLGRRKCRSRGAAHPTKRSIEKRPSPPSELCAVDSLDLSFRQNQGSPEHLMTPQDDMLASSAPRSGHKPKKNETLRVCPLLENRFCDARTRSVLEPACGGFRLVPRRGSSTKSTVCGLNRLLPMLRIGTLYLNPRPRSALLRLRLFAPCWKRKLTFPFWKEKLRLAHFSLLNGIQRFRERREGERQMTQPKRRQPFN
jgi:hypothetical protein